MTRGDRYDWRREVRKRLPRGKLDPAREADVIQELAQHLDDRFEELRAAGASDQEAAAAALDELQGTSRALRRVEGLLSTRRRPDSNVPGAPGRHADVREGAGWRTYMFADVWQDVRFAFRMLRKAPGFTAVAAGTLALGIGGTAAIFTVVNASMLRPLSFPESDRLVRIYEASPERGWLTFSASHPNFLDWVQQSRSFESLAATAGAAFTLSDGGDSERVVGSAVSRSFLPTLGVVPALGRNFLPEEDRPGGNVRVAILSHGFWQRRFGGDPQILERTLTLSENRYAVVGVLPDTFAWGRGRIEVLVPLAPDPARSRGDHRLLVIGRLAGNRTLDEALVDLKTIASRLEQQYPASNKGWTVRIISFYDWFVPEESRQSLFVFVAAVGFVLLIACSNVANLMLARASARQKEIAVRLALGASRERLIRQLLVEAVLLSVVAGAAGLLLALGATELLKTTATGIPRLDELSVDRRVLGFGLAVSVLTGVLFGVVPAFSASRPDLNDTLREGGRSGSAGVRRQRMRGALVVIEVALSVTLLVGAGLLLRSFWRVQRVNPGFDTANLLTLRISLPETRYDTDEKSWSFYERLLGGIAALPGVRAAAMTSMVPLGTGNTATEVRVPGRVARAEGDGSADWRIVSPGYFRTMGIPLRGREFTARDTGDGPPYTIISEAMARRYWPGEDPIGKTVIYSSGGPAPRTIVGVAGDVRSFGLDADAAPMVYFPTPSAASWNPMNLVIRTATAPMSLVPAVRDVLRSIDSTLPFYDVTTADELLAESMGPRRFTIFLLGCFAAVALALASVGLFGVLAYLVSQRTQEIGIRLALGARPRDVFRLVVGRGLALTLAGAACGLAGAFWLAPSLETLLYQVEATDPTTFAGAPILLVAVALVACYVPARRAMRVDPLTALRHE